MTIKKTIHQQLLWVASQLKSPMATAYQISQLTAAETDCTNKQRLAIEKWWQRKLNNEQMRTLEQLEQNLDVLGFEIVIREKVDE